MKRRAGIGQQVGRVARALPALVVHEHPADVRVEQPASVPRQPPS